MFSKSFKTLPCRIIAVVLSAALVLTFMPFLEGPASAAAEVGEQKIAMQSLGAAQATEEIPFTVSKPNSKGIVTINGSLSKYNVPTLKFYQLSVDGWTYDTFDTDTISNYKLDMKKFDVGYHTISFNYTLNGTWFKNPETGQEFTHEIKKVPTKIYEKPSYKGAYTVYSKSLAIYPYKTLFTNNGGRLYLEYKAKGAKKWKRYGYMTCGAVQLAPEQSWLVKGLKPNKTYYTRLRYGLNVTYELHNGGDGKTYFFGGPVLKSKTLKTGKKNKPAVKSAKVKVYGVKYHKIRHPGHYEWVGNVLVWRSAWTEKFYTYKIRVTVKLKKKTGAKGLWISTRFGSKYVKGNKKTYVAKFTPYPNYRVKRPPKGFGKATVKVRSYENRNWGGYSPIAKKKVKVR